MIGAWLHRNMESAPDTLLTGALLGLAGLIVIIALFAPTWVKLGAFVWAIAP